MTLVKVLDLRVVLHFNVLPKILRISFFAYLTFKNTRDFYIKGNMAMLLGLLGQPQHIKKLSFFFFCQNFLLTILTLYIKVPFYTLDSFSDSSQKISFADTAKESIRT